MELQSTTALATTESAALARPDELSVQEIVARVSKVKEVQREVMKDGVHFGKVPGIDKPALMKPGAEILGMAFRLAAKFVLTETFDGPHLTIKAECNLLHAPTGMFLGQGFGSCSTRESKYAWRKGERTCPECGKSCIIKGKVEYGGGWLCFAKKGGCGTKFADDEASITSQQTGRIPNEDVADCYNTVLKMAIKRAHVAAILFVTCASEIFTQDVEDAPRSDDQDADPAPRGNQKSANESNSRAAQIITDYGDAKTGDHLQTLSTECREVWASLSGAEKKAIKAAAAAADARVNPARSYAGTGTDGKL